MLPVPQKTRLHVSEKCTHSGLISLLLLEHKAVLLHEYLTDKSYNFGLLRLPSDQKFIEYVVLEVVYLLLGVNFGHLA